MRDPALQGQRDPDRNELLSRALCLSLASGCAGVLIGSLSVAVGSVGVLGAGRGLLADLAGSAVLGVGAFTRSNGTRSRPSARSD